MSDSEGTRAGREEVWIEKYRPRTLDDIVGQEAIVERLQSYVERDDLPHMLFAGQAGIGKCAIGETPVLTDNGLARMESIVGDVKGFQSNRDGTRVLTLNEAGEFEYVAPSHLFGKTADRVFDVQTRDGAGLTVTPEHKLLVCTAEGFVWREAQDLEEGDRIVRPLEAPLPEANSSLPWVAEMDGDRTLVSVDEAFARRHDIPEEEQYVGTKRGVVRGLRNGMAPDEIADRVGTSRKNVNRIRRELGEIDLSEPSSVCSLGYLRSLECSRSELREHVTSIQNVAPSNNSRSAPIRPVWTVEPRLARLLGLLVAEGRLDGTTIKFYNANERLLEFVEKAVIELFDVDAARGTQQGVGYVEVGNKTLSNFLRASFDVFDGATGGDGIGSTILEAPEDTRAAFLRAMFDAEGHVTPEGVVELTQKNGDIVTLLSYLLAGFGIPSRRKEVEKRATNGTGPARTYHTLLISSAGHLQRFRERVGFSILRKSDRLEQAAARPSNPNSDTLPDQQIVDKLCRCLNISKGEFVPSTLDADAHARADYVDRLEALLSAANQRLETVQKALVQLDVLEPTLERAATVPAKWAAARADLEPLEVRRSLAEEHSVRSDRLLEYARGDRTPYARRAEALLAAVEDDSAVPPVGEIQEILKGIVDRLDIPFERIAERTDLHGSDVGNLLEQSDHEIRSMTRFQTVADALREEVASMASQETVAHLRTLDRLVSTDAYLDEVQTVTERDGERRVYDLTVPETHNYVAGSVPTVMHNTTASQAVARELYGEDWKEHFLELNASDERGIDVVRDRIKSFARTSFGGANYRIIFLDEADALTSDAQSALRRTMEQFSNNVRFILSCNYSSQIIDPIQSRCAVFRFSPLADEAVEEQIRKIADEEGIELTQDGIDALVYAADGDMRRAINGLQAAAVTGGEVDDEAVYEITSTARPEEIEQMVTKALDGDFTAARAELDRLLTEEGIAGGDILDQLHRAVWEFDLDDKAAVRVLDRIGEADFRITEGANERVQLEALLASLALEN